MRLAGIGPWLVFCAVTSACASPAVSVPPASGVPLPVLPVAEGPSAVQRAPAPVAAATAAPAAAPAAPASATPPAPPASGATRDDHLVVSLERRACYGRCPSYVVAGYDDGTIVWTGNAFVATQGERRDHVDPKRLAALAEEMQRARFFDWDGTGRVPAPPPPGTMGVVTVSCTDTSHAITTLRYKGRSATIEDWHCGNESQQLRNAERRVDEVLGTRRWIGAGGAK